MQETWVRSLGQEDLLEKGMATHSSVLAWRIAWTEESGRLPFIGSQRVWHGWSDCIQLYQYWKWLPNSGSSLWFNTLTTYVIDPRMAPPVQSKWEEAGQLERTLSSCRLWVTWPVQHLAGWISRTIVQFLNFQSPSNPVSSVTLPITAFYFLLSFSA